MKSRILIIGACGQIGTELTITLRNRFGADKVVASDIREGNEELMSEGHFELLDATDFAAVEDVIFRYKIDTVYLMAAMLSAIAERFPAKAWHLNMTSLFHILNLAKDKKVKKVFWPSSIAVFGDTTPSENTPQLTVMEPSTVYGISKQTGERWCEYYHKKYGVDVRSIRYPGLISYTTEPGGGTTDYAVDIYHRALKHGNYRCFLQEGTVLPMMYMEDAIRATIDIMDAPKKDVKIRSSYNLAGVSFAPEDVAQSIQKVIPEFEIEYEPDFRQAIADSWPGSIDDSEARKDWGWGHKFDLDAITKIMLDNLKLQYR
ncbi:nucleoside-diphosphate-sugar epimerase [Dokdonia sp. Hel_I_63]|uniref:NAD-dependent epimerase/dehydratase family protein n=1 Tax=unclassified Dokdonia TaxID=2615033 RepID=UPI00020A76EE|nr:MULTISPECIES: NAD-dependent epimerase/dehydratase family protein [unclassified Dokdonia]AEE19273.1 L-threonine 3-dehydrogenase [Dokdonia sp. 4H-3-7-5]TVZ21490.1 nucleoside-diphosphate-sugar epimerase [Dokdonia sp. Hel_I_63]